MMPRSTLRIAVLAFAALVAAAAKAAPAMPFLAAADSARPPPAFLEFCARESAACRPVGPRVASLPLTRQHRADLAAVNTHINRTTREVSDLDLYGREDVWAYPVDGFGDCEDFALAKRRDLIAKGWPSSVLLVTVVRDRRGEGHAVLTVVTDAGDLVLDSRTDRIRVWSETPYTYYQRQSPTNPASWVRLAPADAVVAAKGGKGAASAPGAGGGGPGGNGSANGNGKGNGVGAGASAAGAGNGGGNANAGSGNSNAGGNGSAASGGKAGGTAAGKSR